MKTTHLLAPILGVALLSSAANGAIITYSGPFTFTETQQQATTAGRLIDPDPSSLPPGITAEHGTGMNTRQLNVSGGLTGYIDTYHISIWTAQQTYLFDSISFNVDGFDHSVEIILMTPTPGVTLDKCKVVSPSSQSGDFTITVNMTDVFGTTYLTHNACPYFTILRYRLKDPQPPLTKIFQLDPGVRTGLYDIQLQISAIPEASTVVAGLLAMIPLGASVVSSLRRRSRKI